MSDIANFVQPAPPLSSPSKPSSLPEYLRLNSKKNIEQLQAIDHPSHLLSKLDQPQTLGLDLEINPKDNALIDSDFLVNDHCWHFNAQEFHQHTRYIYELLQNAKFFGGHHLIEFDLTRLSVLLMDALAHTGNQHKRLTNHLAKHITNPDINSKTLQS